MSIKTWIKEFYKKPANYTFKTDKERVQHSLTKWKGVTKKNLDKHELDLWETTVQDDDANNFEFDLKTCALCQKHFGYKENYVLGEHCKTCPITLATGYPCNDSPSQKIDAPYDYFCDTGDPLPMIATLEKTLKFLTKKAKKKTSKKISHK